MEYSIGKLLNVTMLNNKAFYYSGAGMRLEYSNISMINSIFSNNIGLFVS